nr:immunoglobulin heavy chain junction region [Macaca mulatta]
CVRDSYGSGLDYW